MIGDFEQNFVGTTRVFNKKPIIAVLIIDGKFMTFKFEIEPHFHYAVRDKFGNFRAFKFFNVIGNLIEKNDFRHIDKMP